MKSSNLIVWLLVAACLAIDLAMIGELQIRLDDWPGAGGVVGIGLAFAQVTLVSLWLICGRNSFAFRAIGSLLGVWGLSCLGSYSATGGLQGVGEWFGLLLVYCGISQGPLIVARIGGYKLSNQFIAAPSAAMNQSSKQFTIWWLLSLTTAVGTALAVMRFAEFPIEDLQALAVLLVILAATGCTVLLLTLLLSRVSVAIIAAMFVAPIGGLLVSFADIRSESDLELGLMTAIQGVTVLAAAIVLRAGGYRLVRHATSRAVTALESLDASESVSADPVDEL